MSTSSESVDRALSRIENILAAPEHDATRANTGAAPPDTIQPFPTDEPGREQVAKQIYYSLQVPLITEQTLQEVQSGMPALVAALRAMTADPTVPAEMRTSISAPRPLDPADEAPADEQRRLAALTDLIAREAFGHATPRALPLAVIGVAGVIATYGAIGVAGLAIGYTIGKDLAQ